MDTLKHEISGIIAVEPEGGKEARAHAVSAEVEAHNVYLPQTAPWVHDFIEECAAFPTLAHDDQVDAMTQALTRLQRRSVYRLSRCRMLRDAPHPLLRLERVGSIKCSERNVNRNASAPSHNERSSIYSGTATPASRRP